MNVKAIVDTDSVRKMLRQIKPERMDRPANHDEVRQWVTIEARKAVPGCTGRLGATLTITRTSLDKSRQPAGEPVKVETDRTDVIGSGECAVPLSIFSRIIASIDPLDQTFTMEEDAGLLCIKATRAVFKIHTRGYVKPEPVPAPIKAKTPLVVPGSTRFVPAPTPTVTAKTPAPVQPAPKPAPARAVHVPGKRPPDMPESLSAAARSILAALSKVGKPANKAELLAAGANRTEWSAGLSELYRARKLKRAPGADVIHQLA